MSALSVTSYFELSPAQKNIPHCTVVAALPIYGSEKTGKYQDNIVPGCSVCRTSVQYTHDQD